MKVGLLLGSFDPPHIGHLWCAHYALNQGMDDVWVVPAWVNPWKTNQTPYEDRLEMCKLMFNTDDRMIVSDFDGTAHSHYTYEGLQKLLDIAPNNEYFIIGGTDVASQVSNWKEGAWVLKHFGVIEVPRVGVTNEETSMGIQCSSSELKRLIRDGKTVVPFLNSDVINFIKMKKLYV